MHNEKGVRCISMSTVFLLKNICNKKETYYSVHKYHRKPSESECDEIRTRITPNTDTFYAVSTNIFVPCENCQLNSIQRRSVLVLVLISSFYYMSFLHRALTIH